MSGWSDPGADPPEEWIAHMNLQSSSLGPGVPFIEDHEDDGPQSPSDEDLAYWSQHGRFPSHVSSYEEHTALLDGAIGDLIEARATIARVRDLAANMHTWCSPIGVAGMYARRIEETIEGR